MITDRQETHIGELIAADQWSQRDIATKAGVSRGTVAAIISGKYHLAQSERRKRRERSGNGYALPKGEFVRCPGCGGMVQMPCLSCFLENGEKYPSCVARVIESPKKQPEKRRCISCGEAKRNYDFRGDVKSDGVAMHFSTCRSCREDRDRQLALRIKRALLIDGRTGSYEDKE